MKRLVLLIAALVMTTAATTVAYGAPAQKATSKKPVKGGFTVKAHYEEGMPQGTPIYLKVYDATGSRIIDSARVDTKGNFTLKGKVDTTMFASVGGPLYSYFYLFLENTDFTVEGYMDRRPDIAGGSGLNDKYYEYTDLSRHINTLSAAVALCDSLVRNNSDNAFGAYVLHRSMRYMTYSSMCRNAALFPVQFSTPYIDAVRNRIELHRGVAESGRVAPTLNGGYRVRGEFFGQGKDGDTVYLLAGGGSTPFFADSVALKDGRFEFTGRIDFPQPCIVYLGDPTIASVLFSLENSDIVATIEPKGGLTIVSGSKTQDHSMYMNVK